jgi:oxygen-dependent protoporphyrinogen oxidase
MRLKRNVSLFETSLKRIVPYPSLLSPQCIRRCHASSSAYPKNIAVLGGGISGLSSAWFLKKEFPDSKITIFEAGKEAGGWIKSKKVDVAGGHVLLECGPRSLRPGAAALPTAQLVCA